MLISANTVCSLGDFEANSERIGILICKVNEDQNHCGIVYKDKGNGFVLHLASHYDLRNEPLCRLIEVNIKIVATLVHPERQHVIAAMCRKIVRRNQNEGIPYGLSFKNEAFTKEGVLNLPEGAIGLTCATFVIAVFKASKINLIDFDSWNAREDDVKWHNTIIKVLYQHSKKKKLSTEHYNNLLKEVGCARFKPEEVSASATFSKMPALTVEIRKKALELLKYL